LKNQLMLQSWPAGCTHLVAVVKAPTEHPSGQLEPLLLVVCLVLLMLGVFITFLR